MKLLSSSAATTTEIPTTTVPATITTSVPEVPEEPVEPVEPVDAVEITTSVGQDDYSKLHSFYHSTIGKVHQCWVGQQYFTSHFIIGYCSYPHLPSNICVIN